MQDVEKWMRDATEKLEERFGDRLVFVGLQGSFARGEARAESDVDIVVVLDELSFSDLAAYREVIRGLPHPEKACGFISGRKELHNWPKSDLLQFEMETIPWRGSLTEILPHLSEDDIRESLRLAAANLYHAAVHACVHAAEEEKALTVKALYKSAFFALQSLYRLETGQYAKKKDELLPKLSGASKKVLSACMKPEAFTPENADEHLNLLILWCGKILRTA